MYSNQRTRCVQFTGDRGRRLLSLHIVLAVDAPLDIHGIRPDGILHFDSDATFITRNSIIVSKIHITK